MNGVRSGKSLVEYDVVKVEGYDIYSNIKTQTMWRFDQSFSGEISGLTPEFIKDHFVQRDVLVNDFKDINGNENLKARMRGNALYITNDTYDAISNGNVIKESINTGG